MYLPDGAEQGLLVVQAPNSHGWQVAGFDPAQVPCPNPEAALAATQVHPEGVLILRETSALGELPGKQGPLPPRGGGGVGQHGATEHNNDNEEGRPPQIVGGGEATGKCPRAKRFCR